MIDFVPSCEPCCWDSGVPGPTGAPVELFSFDFCFIGHLQKKLLPFFLSQLPAALTPIFRSWLPTEDIIVPPNLMNSCRRAQKVLPTLSARDTTQRRLCAKTFSQILIRKKITTTSPTTVTAPLHPTLRTMKMPAANTMRVWERAVCAGPRRWLWARSIEVLE